MTKHEQMLNAIAEEAYISLHNIIKATNNKELIIQAIDIDRILFEKARMLLIGDKKL